METIPLHEAPHVEATFSTDPGEDYLLELRCRRCERRSRFGGEPADVVTWIWTFIREHEECSPGAKA